MKTKKIIILCSFYAILTLIIVIPEILNHIFSSSNNFAGLFNVIRPYALYIIMPLLLILLIYIIIVTRHIDTGKITKYPNLMDFTKMFLSMVRRGLFLILTALVIDLILTRYVQNYTENHLNFKDIIKLIFATICLAYILSMVLFAYFKGKYEKGNSTEDINALIKKGESLTLEFKQTFFIDVKKKHEEEYIKKESLKNIAGFLNKDGGTLLIGVCDNGDIYGIENDNYKSDDDYLKRFKDIVKTNFIPSVLNLIHYEIVVIDNKKVLRVDCPRSDELIFLKGELDWAYVRTNPAVEKISGAALVDYAKMREKEKEKKINKN